MSFSSAGDTTYGMSEAVTMQSPQQAAIMQVIGRLSGALWPTLQSLFCLGRGW